MAFLMDFSGGTKGLEEAESQVQVRLPGAIWGSSLEEPRT